MQMRLIPTLVSIMQAPPDKIPSGLCAVSDAKETQRVSKRQGGDTLMCPYLCPHQQQVLMGLKAVVISFCPFLFGPEQDTTTTTTNGKVALKFVFQIMAWRGQSGPLCHYQVKHFALTNTLVHNQVSKKKIARNIHCYQTMNFIVSPAVTLVLCPASYLCCTPASVFWWCTSELANSCLIYVFQKL